MSSFFKVVLVLSAFIIIYWTLSYKSAPIIEDAVVENPDVVQDWTPEVSQPLINTSKSTFKDEKSDWEVIEGRSVHPNDAKWYRKLKPKLDRKGYSFCGIRQELLSLEDELIAEMEKTEWFYRARINNDTRCFPSALFVKYFDYYYTYPIKYKWQNKQTNFYTKLKLAKTMNSILNCQILKKKCVITKVISKTKWFFVTVMTLE